MGYILAIYSNQAYQELHLPAIDNSDYTVTLGKGEYALREEVNLLLEVLEGIWSIRPSAQYRVRVESGEGVGVPFRHGLTMKLFTQRGETVALFVLETEQVLRAGKKLLVKGDCVRIGSGEDCDIRISSGVVSKLHAELIWRGRECFVRDSSVNGTYRNNRKVSGQEKLAFGDVLNVYGVSLVVLGKVLALTTRTGEVEVSPRRLEPLSRAALEGPPHSHQSTPTERIVRISPRAIPKLYEEAVTIEPVPARRTEDRKPAWMSVLPSVTMVLPMILGYSLYGVGRMKIGLVIAVGSAVMGLIWASINLWYDRKRQREAEQQRLSRYGAYLIRCADNIRSQYNHNQRVLRELYPDVRVCSQYTEDSVQIWNRSPKHSDFLFVRLGLGDLPFPVQIRVPEKDFSLQDDELAERPGKIARSYRTMHEVPLGVSLTEHAVVGVLSGRDAEKREELARIVMGQIVANHCYTDVKIGVLFRGGSGGGEQWTFARWFPHIWNQDRTMRYIASEQDGMNEMLYALVQILRTRAEALEEGRSAVKRFLPHYVLFVEHPALLEQQMISKYIYERGRELGITAVILADTYEHIPGQCSFVIEWSERFQGSYQVGERGNDRQSIHFDRMSLRRSAYLARTMSSMRVNQVEYSSDLPSVLTFFDMLGVKSPEELNVVNRWRKSRTYESLKALIGVKAGKQPCCLDINERFHGPHGLVAGTTGSGKSETLQTYILSLSINFSPLDVGFFIIDFKGGGMVNLFSKLPHLMGKITNLSGSQIRRAMVSMKSENDRRERLFQEFGVNHIDQYTRLLKNHEATEPMPHLLIIIDEFAELKREQPEFMSELISIAQVGRSQGIHLILATQKPSGAVDGNIWSNSRFKLCLRVADKQDSADMLHRPDAAYLTQAGRCYLQVGNNEIYELFQSGWSGAPYRVGGGENRNNAVMLNLLGQDTVESTRLKMEEKRAHQMQWLTEVVLAWRSVRQEPSAGEDDSEEDLEDPRSVTCRCVALLNRQEECYPAGPVSLRRMEELLSCLSALDRGAEAEETAAALLSFYQETERKLPMPEEKTQLRVTVDYLERLAEEYGFTAQRALWLPPLPEQLALEQLEGFAAQTFDGRSWRKHSGEFRLSAAVGLVDDPENQLQFPLRINLAKKGHLAVVGGVTSGKSTFLQTILFSLLSTYSPQELNVYAIDFSAQMLTPFEHAPHCGGVVLEGEEDKLSKLLRFLRGELSRRKQRIRGGSFGQYLSLHGPVLPAILLALDGYSNFQEKTERQYEDVLQELARTGESYGIFLMISCAGYGAAELGNRIADNMRQSITLEMSDKYHYADALRVSRFDVIPEPNIKGRGLALVDGQVLEYQTALACQADNDYSRSQEIVRVCEQMRQVWTGVRAQPIPVIPDKPTWQQFSQLQSYEELVHEGRYLPAAYRQEDASLWSVDLDRTLCFLILGTERSGKSVLMRNLACAARDAGGKLVFIDTEGGGEKATAQMTGARYLAQPEELREYVRELVLLTNQRAVKRRELRQSGLESEEVSREMRGAYPAQFCFIADLCAFLDTVYGVQGDIGRMNGQIENIFAKAGQMNVYFFAALNLSSLPRTADKVAWLNFIQDRKGVLLGTALNRQTVFSAQNIRFSEQGKDLRRGTGYAVCQEDSREMELIVIPDNRG